MWVPNWLPTPSSYCAVFDCHELRCETEDGKIRRWCEKHAREWDKEAGEIECRVIAFTTMPASPGDAVP